MDDQQRPAIVNGADATGLAQTVRDMANLIERGEVTGLVISYEMNGAFGYIAPGHLAYGTFLTGLTQAAMFKQITDAKPPESEQPVAPSPTSPKGPSTAAVGANVPLADPSVGVGGRSGEFANC